MRYRSLRGTPTSPHTPETPPELPETMRAVRMNPDDPSAPLVVEEVPLPSPALSEVLVRVVAAGINPIDAKTHSGKGLSGHVERPTALGFDVSGEVVRTAYDAHPFPVGTPVYGMTTFPRTDGSFAEYALVPTLSLAPKPVSLSHVEAAGVPLAALTAWGIVVETARAHEGQRMLIHAGSGGVGHFAVQFAAYFGAHVTATASGRNAAWLRELGASVVIDYTTTRFEDVVSDVDVVIDLIGNTAHDTGTRSLTVLRPGGLLVQVPTGSWPTYAEDAAAAGVRASDYKVIPDGAALATIARLLDAGSIRVYVDRIFPLADTAGALDALMEGHTRGKIVVQVADG